MIRLLAQLTPESTGLAATVNATNLSRGDVFETVGQFINFGLGLLGLVVFGYILYAGILWLTAGGDSEKVKTASKIMLNAVIGALILLSSAAIANFVVGNLGTAASGTPASSSTTTPPN